LKELDVKALKTLSQKVNVIPIIAKADSLTAEEKISFKQIIARELEEYEVRTFPSSYPEEVDGAEDLLQHIPFSVIGSDSVEMVNGKESRCRMYRWGVVEVENPEHSDFIHLRELLMSTCLHDLVETTHTIHYHRHRGDALRAAGRPISILECDETYESQIEGTKQINKQALEQREESIRLLFVQKVQEKEAELRQREESLIAKRAEMIAELEQYRALVEAEQKDVDELSTSLSRSGTLSKSSSRLFKTK
ncbi:hypothetical protein BGZ83_001446, partial [Gryganskiella cystojenkinii]